MSSTLTTPNYGHKRKRVIIDDDDDDDNDDGEFLRYRNPTTTSHSRQHTTLPHSPTPTTPPIPSSITHELKTLHTAISSLRQDLAQLKAQLSLQSTFDQRLRTIERAIQRFDPTGAVIDVAPTSRGNQLPPRARPSPFGEVSGRDGKKKSGNGNGNVRTQPTIRESPSPSPPPRQPQRSTQTPNWQAGSAAGAGSRGSLEKAKSGTKHRSQMELPPKPAARPKVKQRQKLKQPVITILSSGEDSDFASGVRQNNDDYDNDGYNNDEDYDYGYEPAVGGGRGRGGRRGMSYDDYLSSEGVEEEVEEDDIGPWRLLDSDEEVPDGGFMVLIVNPRRNGAGANTARERENGKSHRTPQKAKAKATARPDVGRSPYVLYRGDIAPPRGGDGDGDGEDPLFFEFVEDEETDDDDVGGGGGGGGGRGGDLTDRDVVIDDHLLDHADDDYVDGEEGDDGEENSGSDGRNGHHNAHGNIDPHEEEEEEEEEEEYDDEDELSTPFRKSQGFFGGYQQKRIAKGLPPVVKSPPGHWKGKGKGKGKDRDRDTGDKTPSPPPRNLFSSLISRGGGAAGGGLSKDLLGGGGGSEGDAVRRSPVVAARVRPFMGGFGVVGGPGGPGGGGAGGGSAAAGVTSIARPRLTKDPFTMSTPSSFD